MTMRSRIVAGVIAGVVAGIVSGIMMQMMSVPTADGGRVPMMAMGSLVGHLIYGLVLRAAYTPLRRATSAGTPDASPTGRQRRARGAEESI
jgi:hypothetical protein